MSAPSPAPAKPVPDPDPRGTVVVVAVFGAALAAGWLLLYFGVFLPRTTP